MSPVLGWVGWVWVCVWGGLGRVRRAGRPPHRCLAACRLQEEMLQREEAENTLQSFRQVGAGPVGWVGGGRGAAAPHKGAGADLRRSRPAGPQEGGGGEALCGPARVTKALRNRLASR